MRKVLIVVGIVVGVLGVIAALGIAGGVALTRAMKSEAPLAGYGTATPAQAAEVGRRVAAGFNAGEGRTFDEALDLDALLRLMIEDLKLTKPQRRQFIEGFRNGMARGDTPSLGASMIRSMQGGATTLLRTRFEAGHQRALLRYKPESGVNYLELVVALDPQGEPRIVDWYNYLTGEFANVSMRAVAAPFLAELQTPVFLRLAESFANGGKTSARREDLSGYQAALQEVRGRLLSGEHAEALAAWRRLPEGIRATRIGLVLRLQCAQALGDAEYRAAIDDMNARFPDDPGFALAQIDGYFLLGDHAGAIDCIKRLEDALGGDTYLAGLRGMALSELGRHEEAKEVVDQALVDDPDLLDLWWSAVTVSLRGKDHSATARLLDEIEARFDLVMGDLTVIPDYEAFTSSEVYPQWMRARQTQQAAIDG